MLCVVMFLGHLAAALVASRAEPRLPLGTAFVAAELPDVIWPWLLLAGIERVEIAPGDTVVTPLRFVHCYEDIPSLEETGDWHHLCRKANLVPVPGFPLLTRQSS